jgi:aspartate dehydrogenase
VTLRVGIAGLGTIGWVVAKALDRGLPGLSLAGIASGGSGKAQEKIGRLARPVPLVGIDELAASCEVIVECAPPAAFSTIAEAAVARSRCLITVSGAALLEAPGLAEAARAHNARIILATGALLGFDAVRAAAEGKIHSVRMVTRKPPTSLLKAKYVVENDIDLSALAEPLRLFQGSAREGARLFPTSVNVAAALGLAGIGPDLTALEIWADPGKSRNCHRIEVDSDSARITLEIENIPTAENPGTGRITALSMIAALRGLTAPFRVGS